MVEKERVPYEKSVEVKKNETKKVSNSLEKMEEVPKKPLEKSYSSKKAEKEENKKDNLQNDAKREIAIKNYEEFKNYQTLEILLKNKFVISWINEKSLKILSKIKNYDELKNFLEQVSSKSYIGIRSNYNKGTTQLAKFPNEIIKFFGKITILNTNGNRKTMISLLQQFETKFLKSLEMDRRIYSPNKKIYP